MPHDKNGLPLEQGQTVTMRFRVTLLHEAQDFCNVNLESLEKLYPGDYPTSLSSVNTRQVISEDYRALLAAAQNDIRLGLAEEPGPLDRHWLFIDSAIGKLERAMQKLDITPAEHFVNECARLDR